ncbi:cytochrome c family protein [uncultured Parvibaculum sp.]|uniref:c-type cytochrome n=1 Tax=uncultured Parvibaculum sp. TaxID=291828 RepID=UPI0030DBBEAB|tara:strand:- start:133877 stop:134449 length:573 start_codon:yes stop_codon:yes gene_type:complete
MDSFELNKIAGAVLASVLIIIGVALFTDLLYAPEEANPQAYAVAEIDDGGADAGPAAAAEEVPLAVLLASADAGRGERLARQCAACHTFEEGGRAGIGPNLYKVVGGPHAHDPNFNYSTAMKSVSGNWDFEALDAFIENPRAAVPGTIMSFAGMRKPEQRADLIVYLNTLGSNVPLPEAPAQAAEEPAAE